MKIKFCEFINEQYSLTIEDSMDEFEVQDVKWLLEYNINDIWKQYNENKNIDEFINKYNNILLSKKNRLVEIGKNCWNDLIKIVNEKQDENKSSYLNKIYDWADKYGIKINTKIKKN